MGPQVLPGYWTIQEWKDHYTPDMHRPACIKLCSHMRGAVAEQRRADFDIPTPLPPHIRGADADRSAISWGQRWFWVRGFEADAENWVLDPFVAQRILLPLRLRATTAYVWTHVMICVEANFPPASARVRSAHVWTYLHHDNCWCPGAK